jgi:hypothetical protein
VTRANVPDPSDRDSFVLSFRRIWMQEEPSNFYNVVKILKRRVPHWEPILEDRRARYFRARSEFFALPADPALSPETTIDVWLNTRLAHVKTKPSGKRFTREDFDTWSKKLGEAKFEFLFHCALFDIAIAMVNVQPFAEDLMNNLWKQQGRAPSFPFDRRQASGDEVLSDGAVISRSTPGRRKPETLIEKFDRIRNRNAFKFVNYLFEALEAEPEQLLKGIQAAESFEAFAGFIGYVVESVSVEEFSRGAF